MMAPCERLLLTQYRAFRFHKRRELSWIYSEEGFESLELIIYLEFSHLAEGCPMSCHFCAQFRRRPFRSVGRDSSVSIETGYGLDGPGIESRWEAKFSAPVQTGPGSYPASYKMGTGYFPWIKRPGGGWRWRPTQFSVKVKKRVELYPYSPSGYSWPILGWTLLTFLSNIYVSGFGV